MGGFDSTNCKIIMFEVIKKCFLGVIQILGCFDLRRLLYKSISLFSHVQNFFITFQIGEHVPKNSSRELVLNKLIQSHLFNNFWLAHIVFLQNVNSGVLRF